MGRVMTPSMMNLGTIIFPTYPDTLNVQPSPAASATATVQMPDERFRQANSPG